MPHRLRRNLRERKTPFILMHRKLWMGDYRTHDRVTLVRMTPAAVLRGLKEFDLNSVDRINEGQIIGAPICADRNSGARIQDRLDDPNVGVHRRSVSCSTKVRKSWYKLPRSPSRKKARV